MDFRSAELLKMNRFNYQISKSVFNIGGINSEIFATKEGHILWIDIDWKDHTINELVLDLAKEKIKRI